jgi:hypothetical protein
MKYILTIALSAIVGALSAQVAWVEPTPIDPEAPVTLYANLNQSECPDLATAGVDLFIWTWKPAELVAGSALANGTWDSSNDALKMTDEGNGIFSYTLTPTEFYEVSGDQVFEEGFCFLVKAKNGAGGLTTCSEDKTEDLCIEVEPPVLFRPKVYSLPQSVVADSIPVNPKEVFTLIYNHNLEQKAGLVDASSFYVFARAFGTDGNLYQIAPPNQISNTPSLKMNNDGRDYHYWTVVPEDLFADVLPAGVQLSSLTLQIAKEGATSGNDLVDGTFDYIFQCNN